MSDTPQSDLQAALARIAALEQQLAPRPATDTKLVDINDVRVPYVFRRLPVTVYRAWVETEDEGEKRRRAAQLDHPGFDAKTVATEDELRRYLAAGWSVEMVAPADAADSASGSDAAAAAMAARVASAPKPAASPARPQR